jgi:dihydroorotate dehydrogenase (NAD+) catalytic subunit
MIDLRVTVGGLELANPIMPASGTFAESLSRVIDLNRLGAMVTKTVMRERRGGNPLPRVAETHDGMLNSIGIPCKGIEHFKREILPFYLRYAPPLIVSLSAPTAEAFARDARELLEADGIAAIEANISCPNLDEDGRAFAQTCAGTADVVRSLRPVVRVPLWVKLTPNTADIAAVARAAENEGADALVVANTILGMAIDVSTRRPRLGNVIGGLSGPAVKPIILRLVYQCARAVSIPVIGCGGIASAPDAVEYMLAGAGAVQVGTATFVQPTTLVSVVEDLLDYCRAQGVSRIADLVGGVIDGEVPPFEAEP